MYLLKHAKGWLGLSDKQVRISRSTLRYFWLVASLLSVMLESGIDGKTIASVAKASSWAGFYYVAWAMSGQMVKILLRPYDFNASIEQLLHNMVIVLILVLASGTILAQFGFNIVSIVAGLGVAGLAVGFAAQGTLANFIAGIAILIEQSFQVGDWVRIGTQEGRVVRISLRTTHILDRDNRVIILPNSTVASSEVVNLTSKTFIRFDVPVRVALNSDIDKVRSIVLGVLKQNDTLLTHPLPTVTLNQVGEYDLKFIVRFWVSPATVARLPFIQENLMENIKKELDKNGIITPFPHMQVIPHKVHKNDELLQAYHQDTTKPVSSNTKSTNNIYQDNTTNNAQSFPDGS